MTSTVPAAWEGETAVIEVAELKIILVAGRLPKNTWASGEKLVPVIVTLVPPAVEPEEVPRLETVGAEARLSVNSVELLVADMPAAEVTDTSQRPAAMAEVRKEIWVSLLIVNPL